MRLIFTSIFILCSNWIIGQNSDFKNLINKYGGDRIELSKSDALKYFNIEFNEYTTSAYTDKIVFRNSRFIGLSCGIGCPAGGACEYKRLMVFDYNGNLIDQLVDFGSIMADCGFEDSRFCTFASDSLLILVNRKITRDCIKDTVYTNNVKLKSIRIDNNGKFADSKDMVIDTRREYYNISCELLAEKDLSKKTKEEIEFMINEIYASHGYIFKSNKWINYFSKKDWYQPKNENIEIFLSVIEKINLDLIIKFKNN